MRGRKIAALMILAVSAGAFAYTSKTIAFPIFAVLLALAGSTGRFGIDISVGREIIVTLGLTLPFVASWRLSPYTPPLGVTPGINYPLSYAFGLYFLTAQALQFYIHRNGNLHSLSLLFATMAMIAAGNVRASEQQELVYRLLSLYFAVAAVFFVLSFRKARSPITVWEDLGRRAGGVIIMAVALSASVLVTSLLRSHERRIDNLFSRIFIGTPQIRATGFSTLARLDSVNRMKHGANEQKIALRVFSENVPPYMRGIVYTRYGAGTWQSRGKKNTLIPVLPVPPHIPRPTPGRNVFMLKEEETGELAAYDVWPDPAIEEGMFTPLGTAAMNVPVEILDVDPYGVTDSGELIGGMNYIGYVPRKRAPESLSEEERERTLQVPASIDPRIRKIAEEIFEGCATAREKIQAVMHFFHRNFEYELGIQIPRDADPLAHFLVNKPPAHCEYFATGAAVLLRMGGVPARYVAGFVPAGRIAYGGYWVARNKDAHAWAEAYDDARGWTIVEATPGSGVPSQVRDGRLSSLLDYLKLLTLKAQVAFRTEGVMAILLRVLSRIGLAAVLIAAAAVAALVVLRRRRRRRGILPGKTDPSVTALQAFLSVMDTHIEKNGIERRTGETLLQFAGRLSASETDIPNVEDMAQWYRDYAGVRYSGDVTQDDLERLRETLPA